MKKLTLTLATLSTAIAMTACSTSDAVGSGGQTAPNQNQSSSNAPAFFNPRPNQNDDPEECTDNNPQFHQRYGAGAEGVTATTHESVNRLFYTVTEGGYDPCQPISFAVLEGEMGNSETGPGGTGASIAEGLIVFQNDQAVGGDNGLIFHDVIDIHVVDDTTIEATLGFATGATFEGTTEEVTVEFEVYDGALVASGGNIEKYSHLVNTSNRIIP